jgi:hypothetical protein
MAFVQQFFTIFLFFPHPGGSVSKKQRYCCGQPCSCFFSFPEKKKEDNIPGIGLFIREDWRCMHGN